MKLSSLLRKLKVNDHAVKGKLQKHCVNRGILTSNAHGCSLN